MRGLTLVVALLLLPTAAAAQPCAEPLAVLFERVSPAVVSIQATKINKAKPTRRFETIVGSGMIIEKDGHVLTNAHVVDGAASLSVTLDHGIKASARILGIDPVLDVALIRVDGPNPLPVARLGDSSTVRVGDEVIAIGNPIGLDQTMTRGIVSGLNRTLPGISDEPMIQTDAPINPGNSGGPLINARGQVIGVNTQIETGTISTGNVGIGFAVPSNTVKDVVAQILRTGRVEHAWLGIRGQPVTQELADTFNLPVEEGVLVESVIPGSGAAKADLQSGETEVVVAGETYILGGDIIVSVDDEKIAAIEEIRDVIAAHKPGEKIKLGIFRDQKKSSVNVTLGRQPSSPQG
jgi:putative serine protease PepD